MYPLSAYERLTDMVAEGRYENIFLCQHHRSIVRPIATGCLGMDVCIFINELSFSTDAERRLAFEHELAHIEYAGFYNIHTPKDEVLRIEYHAHKKTVEKLVCFDDYSDALMSGCFDIDEQAAKWNIPEHYVPKVHEVYERTRWEEVQELRAKLYEKFVFVP